MVRMEADDYINQQESIEGKLPNKCLHCKKELVDGEEYLCDDCYTKAMKEDIKAMCESREEGYNSDLDNENWRFTNSRGQSVFRREL